jgi:hypothetical protein
MRVTKYDGLRGCQEPCESYSSGRDVEMIAADDQELTRQLLDDVNIIEAHFTLGVIPRPSLLRTCFVPILRRWIAEGVFFRAQKLILPTQVTFATTSNTRAIDQCRAGVYEHWMELMFFGTLGVSVSQRTAQHLKRRSSR